jgi:hypothetical protein
MSPELPRQNQLALQLQPLDSLSLNSFPMKLKFM